MTLGQVLPDQVCEFRDRVDQVLAVVEDDEAALVLEGVQERFEIVALGPLAEQERIQHCPWDPLGVAHRGQLHEPDSLATAVEDLGGDLQREARLARAARARQRQKA